MARPKIADDSHQTAVRLSQALHDRLKKSAGKGGLATEIRRRLEASYAGETPVPATHDRALAELLQDIATVAGTLEVDAGWQDTSAFEFFKAAVNVLIEAHRPKAAKATNKATTRSLFAASDDPATVGRLLAATARLARKT